MKGSRAASRYAKSLFSLSVERKELDAVHQDMVSIANTCENSRELQLLLKSPVIKPDKKLNILKVIFGGKTSKTVAVFLEIITKKKRAGIVEEIAQSFLEQYRTHKNIVSAKVSTARKLDKETKEKIMNIVEASTKGKVELIEKVDENLIGGFVLRIGDTQVDSSIQRKLSDLHRSFSKNAYVKEF